MAGAGGKEVGRISIRVVPDTDQFRRELKTELDKIEREVRGKVPVDVDLDTAGAKEHLRALMAEMKAMAHKGVDVKVGVNKSQTQEIASGLGNMARSLTQVGDGASYSGLQFLGLTRYGWMATAVFAAAAPIVGLVAGLLAGLPSLISGALIPMGTIALGLDGIKKAALDAGILGEGKRGKTTLGESLMALKATVSDVFANGLRPVFQDLVGLMPVLQTGFAGVAQGLVNMAGGLTHVLTANGGAQLQQLFANTANLMNQMTPVMASLTQTFLTLAVQGGNAFNLLTAPLQQFAFGFEQMINKAAASGVLKEAFQGLSETLGPLLNLFTGLFEAGLQAMGQLGGPLGNMVNGLGEALIALTPALTSLSGLIGNVLGALGHALAPVITALTPAFTQLANLLGMHLSVVLTALSPIITQIAGGLSDALLPVINEMIQVFPQLYPAVQAVAQALTGALAQSLPQIATAFGQLAAAVIPLMPALMQMALVALPPLITLFTQLTPVVVGFINGITGMVQILTGVISVMAGLSSTAGEVATAFGSVLAPAFDQVKSTISGAISAVQNWATATGNAVQQVVQFFLELPGKVMSAIANLGEQLFQAGAKAVQRFIDGLRSIDVIGAAKAVLGGIFNLIPHSPAKEGPFASAGWGQLFTGGQAIGQQFEDGLKSGFQGVVQSATALIGQVQDAMNQGMVPNGLVDNVRQELKAIAVEYDQLKIARDNAGSKDEKNAISGQMKQLQALRDQLRMQSEQVGYSDKYGKDQENVTQQLGQQLNKMIDIGKGFGMANLKQFESDLGISGSGAIPTIAEQGIGWLTSTVGNLISGAFGGGNQGGVNITVNNVDDALNARQNLINKQALGVAGR